MEQNHGPAGDVDKSETSSTTVPIAVVSTSLHALFQGIPILASDGSTIEGQISLPEYQRPYRWTVSQFDRLLKDLDHFAAQHSALAPDANAFYLGSIVLHQDEKAPGGAGALHIIDGQQRLTSMAILGCLLGTGPDLPGLRFSPESQERIRANVQWLGSRREGLPKIDFSRVNITLVVTRSEDDAYRFFETQNTGGVRLDGPAILKAHHLRAVQPETQDLFARHWESMGDITPVVDATMKARHWRGLRWRGLASHRAPRQLRDEIVAELQGNDVAGRADIAYRPVQFLHEAGGWRQHLAAGGYAMRQPLNAGANSIHYLQYFHALHEALLIRGLDPALAKFHALYRDLCVKARPSDFLHKLFDTALLLYASQFGTERIHEACLWIFRVSASPRLSNKTTVRESTCQAFARSSNLLDTIVASHNHEELMEQLQAFEYTVDANGLAPADKSTKRRFVCALSGVLGFEALPEDAAQLAKQYDRLLVAAIGRTTRRAAAHAKADA
jgi:hypothetical protein